MKRRSTVAVLLGVFLATGGIARGELFKDGEIVCFLGDSITNRGQFQNTIYNYYLTRFPEWTIRFVNAGRSGDSAGGALGRLQEDVVDRKPTSVAVMFGMNDVNRGAYVSNPDEKKLAAQKQALDGYRKNMEKLTERIRTEAGEPRLIFITPSPFDQTVVLEKNNNQPGCNDGLGRCGEIVRELAAKNNGAIVDFHGPMTAFNLEQQKKDPKYTIVGGDRVHPGAQGMLMMAWLFLKTQGVSPVVSMVAVDAASARATRSVNAQVTAVAKKGGGLTFTIRSKALPLPIDPAAKSMLAVLPVEKDLNQELLAVVGLADGDYELKIDGETVGCYAAAELAKGINLAFNEKTPQFKQAQAVARINEQRRNAECQARSLLNTRRWMQSHYKINVDDPAAVQAHYDSFKDKTEYSAAMALNYIKNGSRYGEYVRQMTEHETALLASRAPVPHAYAVVRAAVGTK